MKRRNPRYGCSRIAQQINLAFGLDLDKHTVRRVIAVHYKPDPTSSSPSWLTTLGHAKDSLWSLDLLRAESITLKTHWIMVVMDQYTRRIVGFAVHYGNVDAPQSASCSMKRPVETDGQKDSVPIMIHCFNTIGGKPTSEYSKSKKSNRYHTYRCHIRS